MWSLPDIVRLNEEAAQDAKQNRFQLEVAHPEEHPCEACGWVGKETPADYSYLTYDIFSDDPKGTIFLCEQHDGYTGSPLEGYFTCGQCDRVFIENITWERYAVVIDEEELCLPCALKRYLSDESHWIDPTKVNRVIIKSGDPSEDVFDGETGTVNFARTRHLLAVEMPIPPEITFRTNLEFDSSTGEMLATTSSTYPKGVGEAAALLSIRDLADDGYTRFLPVMDGAYQFSVSIGLYLQTAEHEAILSGEKNFVTGGQHGQD